MRNKYGLIIATVLAMAAADCQAEDIGTWKLYTCYAPIEDIAPAGNMVFVKANGALYSYNTKDNSIDTYSKMDALTSQDITLIEWVPQTRKLVVVYKDCTIDLLSDNGNTTETITDIKNKITMYSKTINNILVDGAYAYLCTDFGLMKVNTKDVTITNTYNISMKVQDMHMDASQIFIKTDDGIYHAQKTANLSSKGAWVECDSTWEAIKPAETEANEYGMLIHDKQNACYWGSNSSSMLTRYKKEEDSFVATSAGVIPDGPPTSDVYRVYRHKGRLYCTAGLYIYGYHKDIPGKVYYQENNVWKTLEGPNSDELGYRYLDANVMAFDPSNDNHFFVGGESGLYEYLNDKCVMAYNTDNSPLLGVGNVDSKEHSIITSLTFDKMGKLWVTNGWVDTPIQSFKHSSSEQGRYPGWEVFKHDEATFANRYAIDLQGTFFSPTNGLMWFTNFHWGHPALYAYDSSADRLTKITSFRNQDGATLSPNYTYSTTEDKEGNVWLCTDCGPAYITPADLRSSGIVFTQHKIPRNDGTGLADYLLNNVAIKHIAVDAANRKWMVTPDNGVYLISDDCNTEIAHFTVDNSPLPSNVIYSVTIDDATGWVYFATEKGLCAYLSDITQEYGSELSEGSIYAFPNPVTPEYTGMITIAGITKKSQIKITDASGHLVNSGSTASGSYRWNGCDGRGTPVASGIYMVMLADEEGDKGCVAKIAIIR